MNSVKSGLQGEQFMPKLPKPKPEPSTKKRISYSKNLEEIEVVQSYLFDENHITPSEVGEKCFDVILREAHQ